MTGWSVMWSTSVSLRGPFGKDLRSISGPFPIYDHGNQTSVDNFSILGRESHNLTKTSDEAI